jgi:hypothetical protein
MAAVDDRHGVEHVQGTCRQHPDRQGALGRIDPGPDVRQGLPDPMHR